MANLITPEELGIGNFNDSSTWIPTQVPVSGDVLTIRVDTVVILDGNGYCQKIQDRGRLVISQGSALTFDDDPDAGLNNGDVLVNGTEDYPCLIRSAGGENPTNPYRWTCDNSSSMFLQQTGAKSLPSTGGSHGFYDCLYSFNTSDFAEINISGSMIFVRSRVSSPQKYFIKPVGNVSASESFFDGCLPSIYNSVHHIKFYDQIEQAVPVTEKFEAIHAALGGNGEYGVVTGYRQSLVIEGRVGPENASRWNHPLSQRLFVSQMNALRDDPNELVKVTWCGGHFASAHMTEFKSEFLPGRDWQNGYWRYRVKFTETPYQVAT